MIKLAKDAIREAELLIAAFDREIADTGARGPGQC